MINVALIGLGYWGRNYLRVLQKIEVIKLSYVCDSNPETLKDVLSYVKTTLDYEEIAKDDDIKTAFLATPASTHYIIAKLFLEQGKHLLVGKPLTMNVREAFELAKIAKENKEILMVGHIYCFHPAIQYLRKLFKNKKLGKVFYGIAIRIGLGPIIKDNVKIGANTVILRGITIGEYSIVDAGAVVTKDIPPKSVVYGVPAKIVETLESWLKRHGISIINEN